MRRRVALITGGTKGIGKAIAMKLLEEDYHVVVCARNISDDVDKKIVQVKCDVTDQSAVRNVISEIVERFGGIDVLVNNVGGAIKFGGLNELEEDDWHRAFSLNVMSVVRFIKNSIAWLKKSDSPRIVNISSSSGHEPGAYNPHYSSTKAAIINLTKHFANVFAKDGILVNVVCSGPVYSESWNENIKRIADRDGISFEQAQLKVEEEESNKIPLKKIGSGKDVAEIVSLLASDRISWITGSSFRVDGGKSRSML